MSGEAEPGANPLLSIVVPVYCEVANVPVLVERVAASLPETAWEIVFVDDDSPDGTADQAKRIAASDPRIRCIRRIGRRGLSSAVIEGVLSCSSPIVAVMDGDLQHDETRLAAMLARLLEGDAEVIVASRFAAGGDAAGLSGSGRLALSNTGIRLATAMLGTKLTDPMSGFFMMRRALFETIAPRLTGEGFKILLDLLLSSPTRLRVEEVGAIFRPRLQGESKLSPLVLVQFLALLFDKATGGVMPMRFLSFALVGAFGVLVHLAVLITLRGAGSGFVAAQTAGTVVAMVANFVLNNQITYRDQRLRGGRLWRGLVLFMLVCGVGAVANIGIARALYAEGQSPTPAGAVGAVIGVVWNYAMSATLVWNRRRRVSRSGGGARSR